MFSYYSSVLEGKITWTEWQSLSPKEKDYAMESLDEIRTIQKETFKTLNKTKGAGENVNV